MTDAESAGPERIRSIAVHREDVATALEATLRSDQTVVLRVTPPFSGRMRARLHSLGSGRAEGGASGRAEGGASSRAEGGASSRAEGRASDPSAGGASDDPANEGEAEVDHDPIHVDPRDLVDEVPAYPEADDTAARYPEADVETRRDRHGAAVEAWRERVRRSVVDSVAIDGDGGATREIDVVVLG